MAGRPDQIEQVRIAAAMSAARRTPAPPNGEALPGQLLRLFRLVVDRDMEVDVRAFDAGDRYRHAVGVIVGHELALQLRAYDTLQVRRAGHRIRATAHLFGELIAHRAGDGLLVDGHGLGDRRG